MSYRKVTATHHLLICRICGTKHEQAYREYSALEQGSIICAACLAERERAYAHSADRKSVATMSTTAVSR